MRYGKNIFLEQYDPTIEGTSPIFPQAKRGRALTCAEEYDLTVEYEGKRSRVRYRCRRSPEGNS